MPDTLSPITREETYLAAIAGEDVTTPDPICRKEEFLAAIDGHVDAIEDVAPTPAAADEGKVLTAGADGTASWQDAPKELPASLGTAGQVLTVNAGANGVEWATPSGGGGGFADEIVVFAVTDNGDDTFTVTSASETIANIYSSLMQGKVVWGKVNIYSGGIIVQSVQMPFEAQPTQGDNTEMTFERTTLIVDADDGLAGMSYNLYGTHESDADAWEMTFTAYYPAP